MSQPQGRPTGGGRQLLTYGVCPSQPTTKISQSIQRACFRFVAKRLNGAVYSPRNSVLSKPLPPPLLNNQAQPGSGLLRAMRPHCDTSTVPPTSVRTPHYVLRGLGTLWWEHTRGSCMRVEIRNHHGGHFRHKGRPAKRGRASFRAYWMLLMPREL